MYVRIAVYVCWLKIGGLEFDGKLFKISFFDFNQNQFHLFSFYGDFSIWFEKI